MIPNFNPDKWNREKIIDYVIGNRPLDDQQLAFLNYFEKAEQEHKALVEFEKWLEREIDPALVSKYTIYFPKTDKIIKKQCLDKLKELKEGKK